MKTKITVATREEGRQIRLGLTDPMVRVFVSVIGVLAELPSDCARERVLSYASSLTRSLNEDH